VRVRVVDLEVGVVDAGVDGLVSKRLLGIKSDVIYSTPDRLGRGLGIECGRNQNGDELRPTGTAKRASSKKLCLAKTLQL